MRSSGDRQRVPALPDRCPRCDTRGWNLGAKFFSGNVRSPIRAHTSGAAQATQLYLSQLVRSMGETAADSRTIVFTDSRDDAARTAAGVGLNHHRDVIRQLTQQVLSEEAANLEEIVGRAVRFEPLNAGEQAAFEQFRADCPSVLGLLQKAAYVALDEEESEQVRLAFETHARRAQDLDLGAARGGISLGRPRHAPRRTWTFSGHESGR